MSIPGPVAVKFGLAALCALGSVGYASEAIQELRTGKVWDETQVQENQVPDGNGSPGSGEKNTAETDGTSPVPDILVPPL